MDLSGQILKQERTSPLKSCSRIVSKVAWRFFTVPIGAKITILVLTQHFPSLLTHRLYFSALPSRGRTPRPQCTAGCRDNKRGRDEIDRGNWWSSRHLASLGAASGAHDPEEASWSPEGTRAVNVPPDTGSKVDFWTWIGRMDPASLWTYHRSGAGAAKETNKFKVLEDTLTPSRKSRV
uniref:Uncharacterized protein n=1 Tax=Steinernema glaseri TaxID=37863 RepID=A0A1I8AKV8_9BILA